MRTTRSGAALALLALLPAAACKDEAPPPPRPMVVLFVPKPHPSRFVDTTGGPDVERWTMDTPFPADSVAAFFRTQLGPAGWTIRNDQVDAGATNLLAERVQDGQPLWVRIERRDSANTRYTLIAGFRPPGADTTRPR